MTTYTDAFNRADESPIAAPWAVVTGTPKIESQYVKGDAFAAFSVARIPTATTGIGQTDHYAQAKIVSAPAGSNEYWAVICVRCSAVANTWYGYRGDNTDSEIVKCVAGTITVLQTGGPAFVVNDVVYLSVEGDTLIAKVNASQTLTVAGGSAVASGDPGWGAHHNGPTPRLDDFEAGDIAAGGGPAAAVLQLMMAG